MTTANAIHRPKTMTKTTTMTSNPRQRPLFLLPLTLLSLTLLLGSAAANPVAADRGGAVPKEDIGGCERLPTSLTYSQDSAPADVSAILRVVVEKINRDVTGVVDVEVAWSGAELHRRVGAHIVRSTVTRLADSIPGDDDEEEGEERKEVVVDSHGRAVVAQCFEVPFVVNDVDECTAPRTNPMAHRCRSPSVCVNTQGSYECVCPSEGFDDIVVDAASSPDDFWRRLEDESRNPWELSLENGGGGGSSCPGGAASTRECCDEDGMSEEGRRCRESFHCPVDPCAVPPSKKGDGNGNNKRSDAKAPAAACAAEAVCRRSPSPLSDPDHVCECPPGLFGNGAPCPRGRRRAEARVRYDGTTPTEETRRALERGEICGCVRATVDACDGFPKCPGRHETCTVSAAAGTGDDDGVPRCTCRPGYISHPDYGCVDESPPRLRLRPDPVRGLDARTGVSRLAQGDRYEEHGVDVVDDNAEEYLRSLKMTYSRPLPRGCLLELGEFRVDYTVATPWTTPEFVSARRTVVIENVDECAIGKEVGEDCPELVAMCDEGAGATCRDEVGTYACECPEGTEGDGFRPIARLKPDGEGGFAGSMVPKGYRGGTGCRDTSKPVIELAGPNPKRFRVAKTSAVRGVKRMGGKNGEESNARVEALLAEQRSSYESDIKSMIMATAGAELCATVAKPNVRPNDCAHAHDRTYKGIVDLTSRISVGEPVPTDDGGSPLKWKVPYDVADDAGNEATTVWRDIIVEEVDIDDFEQRAKAEVRSNRKEEVDRAVEEALAKERRNRRSSHERDCPTCEPCTCNNGRQKQQQHGGGGTMSVAECDAVCDRKMDAASSAKHSDGKTCTPSYLESNRDAFHQPIVQEFLAFVEDLVGFDAMMLLLVGCTIAAGLYLLRRIVSALFFGFGFGFGPSVQTYYHTREDDERERDMMRNVSYYRSPTPPSRDDGGDDDGRGSSPRSGLSSSSSAAATSGPRPPPTASISSQRARGGGIFSPPRGNSPFSSGSDSIYQSMSPITPLRNGGTPPASSSSTGNSRGSASSQRSSPYNGY